MSGRVYTISSGVPFLKALAQGLLARHPSTDDPFALAAVTVFLPTRRAVRGLEEAFLEAQAARGRSALFLPRMRPLGSVDEDEIALGAEEDGSDVDVPPAVPALHRRVRLAQLLMRARKMPFAEALIWAKSLARFLDEALIEEVDLAQIERTIPEDLARHFQSSRELIGILTEHWKAILAEDGFIEAADRRARLMAAEAERWRRAPPSALYIAGSTGSIPATARLMAAALELPQGALILPGLDRELDEAAWSEVDETHPQFGLKRLLERLEITRGNVGDWPHTEGLGRTDQSRVRLVGETLRPAPTTDSWTTSLAGVSLEAALAGLKLAIARDQSEEARVIALAMREQLERPGATAALVTPDRRLARRVSAELKRWGIEVDDSAGVPLAQTAPMILLQLILDGVSEGLAPIPLLSLLKHPLARIGFDEFGLRLAVSQLEKTALRGPRPAPGFAGLRTRITEKRADLEEPRVDPDGAESHERKFARIGGLVDRLELALAPLVGLSKTRAAPAAWVMALVSTAEQICERGAIWQGDEGEAAATLLHLIGDETATGEISLADFVHLFDAATEGVLVRPRSGLHPRLNIWGPLEARLQSADLIILGGLNEGIWPARAEIDPWANRPMREALELSKPERRIGLAAHDFQELSAAPRVLMTASKKVDGSPVLLSRWLMRLENFLNGREAHAHLQLEPFVAWARAIDAPRTPRPVPRPKPTPPVSIRPRSFSITDIKTLRRDPYAIFAREILRLRPLDPVDEDATPRLRGTLFHQILEEFALAYPELLPDDALDRLLALGETHLAASLLEPEVKELWRAMLKRAGTAFVEWETEQRKRARIGAIERRGQIELKIAGALPITLRGRIDRIDVDHSSGTLTVLDYKTGKVPTIEQVKVMLDPQLPLGALLAREGKLEGVAPAAIDRLLYLQVGGGSAKFETVIDEDVEGLIARTEAGLIELLVNYERESTPYHSWAIPFSVSDTGDYDLLARVDEWRIQSGEEE